MKREIGYTARPVHSVRITQRFGRARLDTATTAVRASNRSGLLSLARDCTFIASLVSSGDNQVFLLLWKADKINAFLNNRSCILKQYWVVEGVAADFDQQKHQDIGFYIGSVNLHVIPYQEHSNRIVEF